MGGQVLEKLGTVAARSLASDLLTAATAGVVGGGAAYGAANVARAVGSHDSSATNSAAAGAPATGISAPG